MAYVINIFMTKNHESMLQGLRGRSRQTDTYDFHRFSSLSGWWLWNMVDIVLEYPPHPSIQGRHLSTGT